MKKININSIWFRKSTEKPLHAMYASKYNTMTKKEKITYFEASRPADNPFLIPDQVYRATLGRQSSLHSLHFLTATFWTYYGNFYLSSYVLPKLFYFSLGNVKSGEKAEPNQLADIMHATNDYVGNLNESMGIPGMMEDGESEGSLGNKTQMGGLHLFNGRIVV